MRWKAVVKHIDIDKEIVYIQCGDQAFSLPKRYLPNDCKVGDVLQFAISFDPFETLRVANDSRLCDGE